MGVKSATPGAAKKRRVSLDTSSKFNPELESQKKSDTDAVSSSTKQKELSSRMKGGVKEDQYSRLQPLKVSIKTQESNYTEEAGRPKLSGVQSLPSLGRGIER